MHRRLRSTLASCLLVMAVAVAGCSDESEPRRELEIQVSPDTVRFDVGTSNARIVYTMRNISEIELRTTFAPEVQAELSPGSWTTLVNQDTRYIQDALTEIVPIPRGYVVQRTDVRALVPGRYRLRATYRRADPPGATEPSPSIETLSNVFVVPQ